MAEPTDETGQWSDDRIVLLSALNDYLYCPRRAWLHRVEGVFVHTGDTLEGSHAHKRTDKPGEEHRDGVRMVHGLPLFSKRLGLSGKADTVEFHPPPSPGGPERPFPVEHKHGRRRKWDNDDVQLCAQALCLEEMFRVSVPAGAIYHVRSKRRREVAMTERLRQATSEAITALRTLIACGDIPPPLLRARCKGCSLHSLCMPEISIDSNKVVHMVSRLYRCESDIQDQSGD